MIPESHPLYLGIYEGAMGRKEIRQFVEDSDCVIILGAFMTDVNLGIYTANLDRGRSIYATSEKIAVRYHTYEDVMFDDFIDGINSSKLRRRRKPNLGWTFRDAEPFAVKPNAPLTVSRLFQHLNEFLSNELTVIADVGDSLFGAAETANTSTHQLYQSGLLHFNGFLRCRHPLAHNSVCQTPDASLSSETVPSK